MWINDFNTKNISGAADATLRYAVSRYFSLGLMGGYDALQTKNEDNIVIGHYALQHSYLVNKGFSANLLGWLHFNAGNPASPYIYLGVGGMMYNRKVENEGLFVEDKNSSSFHIPVGIGLEIAAGHNTTFSLDLGARLFDNWTDYFPAQGDFKKNILGTDWAPAGRVGLNFYFGDSDDDDTDADLLTNGFEKKIGTDPTKGDSDGDGLTDGEEVITTHTDPLKTDSDGDGLSDGKELKSTNTNPNKPDTDGDKLSDGDEVNKYSTDPTKVDTDGDGLTDGDEVLTYNTDPLKIDTDGDKLTDGQEVNTHHTNPLKADTDGGTVEDGIEVARGSNPLEPIDDVPKPMIKVEAGKAIVLEGIVFKTGKSTIEPQSEDILTQAFNTLMDNPNLAVEIRGYTDNVGKVASNKKLSLARADAVKSWLVHKGIDSTRILTKGFGMENPIGDNKTAEGRAKNRRIEFYRTK